MGVNTEQGRLEDGAWQGRKTFIKQRRQRAVNGRAWKPPVRFAWKVAGRGERSFWKGRLRAGCLPMLGNPVGKRGLAELHQQGREM